MTAWLRPLQQSPEYSEVVFHEMFQTTVDSVLGVGTFFDYWPTMGRPIMQEMPAGGAGSNGWWVLQKFYKGVTRKKNVLLNPRGVTVKNYV